jgi:hypothetical protein
LPVIADHWSGPMIADHGLGAMVADHGLGAMVANLNRGLRDGDNVDERNRRDCGNDESAHGSVP